MCFFFFFFNDTATTEIYTLSLHDALPISPVHRERSRDVGGVLAPLRAGVDDDQVPVARLPAVDVVVQRGRVRAAADDGRVAHAGGAVPAEPRLQHRLDLVFVHPPAGPPPPRRVPRRADVH